MKKEFRIFPTVLIIILILTCVTSCKRNNETKEKINSILSDTLEIKINSIEVEIDSMNSGITRNMKEINTLRDSIEVNFDGYFYGISVILIHNESAIYIDTLETDECLGWSSNVKFKRDAENYFKLKIYDKWLKFRINKDFNFVHILDTKFEDLRVIETNKGYIYE